MHAQGKQEHRQSFKSVCLKNHTLYHMGSTKWCMDQARPVGPPKTCVPVMVQNGVSSFFSVAFIKSFDPQNSPKLSKYPIIITPAVKMNKLYWRAQPIHFN